MKYTDVICVNRYYAWYHDAGAIELIQKQFDSDLNAWHDTFHKPILQAEYGADALSCLHQVPAMHFHFYFHSLLGITNILLPFKKYTLPKYKWHWRKLLSETQNQIDLFKEV